MLSRLACKTRRAPPGRFEKRLTLLDCQRWMWHNGSNLTRRSGGLPAVPGRMSPFVFACLRVGLSTHNLAREVLRDQ
jgi:hypothetical protein